MNILFYIPNLDQTNGGVRQYSLGLLSIMANLKEHKFYILHNKQDTEILRLIDQEQHIQLIPPSIGRERKLEKKIYKLTRALQFLNEKRSNKDFKVRSHLDRICRKYKIDIVHSPVQEQPFPRKTKNIFTLHDVQELHFPEYFTAEDREYRARTWLYNLKRSDKIIVSYQHVKNDLLKYFKIEEDMVSVLLLEMQNLWFKNYSESDIKSTKELHGFEKFLLYPANTWQHKNHLRLIDAIHELRAKHNIIVNVVCTGHQNEHFTTINRKLNELGLENQVKFLGIVDEQTLFSLYQHCTGVVIPTLYEAGSFPLMESIILEIPVICSNVTSLPETIGKDDYIFDPTKVEEMADLILKIWSDDEFRKGNTDHLKKMQNRLFNTGATEKLRSIYESLSS
ncbi:MAG: glycosyltransferase family 4 protein [Crocinitomicaceae bacterium]|nr:glycosyltransferase family 4 protein [Crocinitomicaceae bacterium]